MVKNGLSTPFDCDCKAPSAHAKGNNGTYDRHTTPALSKPRDVGKDAPREIFFTDIPGSPMRVSLEGSLKGGTSMKFK